MRHEPVPVPAVSGIDWKGLGYLVSICSVFLLGAVAWPKPDSPILIAAYTQGGTPNSAQLEAVFARIGRMVGERLG